MIISQRRVMVALLILAAFAWGLLVPPPAPADAAPTRPHYVGTVEIWYQVSKKWDVPKAVKASGIKGYRLKRIPRSSDPIMCGEERSRQCLMVWSLDYDQLLECRPPHRETAGPSVVCLYRGNSPVRSGQLTDSTIDLDDSYRLSQAQRHAILTSQFRKALPR